MSNDSLVSAGLVALNFIYNSIINDLHESFQQADNGQVLGIDETFDNVFASLKI